VGKSIVYREKLDKGEMTEKEYQQLIGNVPDGRGLPNVKMLLMNVSNPLVVSADTNTNIKALKSLILCGLCPAHESNR